MSRYLDNMWRRFEAHSVPVDIAPRAKVFLRRAFYAGARGYSQAVDENMRPGMTAPALEHLAEELESELGDFEDLVRVGRA